jgi:hypothetical protein
MSLKLCASHIYVNCNTHMLYKRIENIQYSYTDMDWKLFKSSNEVQWTNTYTQVVGAQVSNIL